MTTIWDVYQFMLFVANKARGGMISPGEGGFAAEAGQNALFSHYWNGGNLVKASIEALSPFSKSVPLTSSTAGVLTLPADHAHTRLFSSPGFSQAHRELKQESLTDTIKSQLYPISKYPRWMPVNGSIQLYPDKATNGTLYYYSRPLPPVIGFTLSGDDEVYDAGTSTQLGFAKRYWNEVVLRALPYIGVNLSSETLAALSKEFERA